MLSSSKVCLEELRSIRREVLCCSIFALPKHPKLQTSQLNPTSPTFVDLVKLISQVCNDRVMLLPDVGQAVLVVEVGVVQLLLELEQLRLSLLVDVHSSSGSIPRLLQTAGQLLNLSPEEVPALLSLPPVQAVTLLLLRSPATCCFSLPLTQSPARPDATQDPSPGRNMID